MKKLIEVTGASYIVCDNPNCNIRIPYKFGEDILGYVNKRCSRCGEILLTPKDYLLYERLRKNVDYMNRWFSWLTWFPLKRGRVSVQGIDGVIKIKKQ